jgi:hypothetical protein
LSCFLWSGFRAIELLILDSQDTATSLTVFRYFFRIVGESVFFGTVLLIAKGWCIVRDSISLKEIVRSMIFSLCFIFFRILLDVVNDKVWGSVLIVLSGVSMVLFMRELIVGSREATMHILAHMLAISNEGINPRTTPIYQKHRLYRKFQLVLVLFTSTTCAADSQFIKAN